MDENQLIIVKDIAVYAKAAGSTLAVLLENISKEDIKLAIEDTVVDIFLYKYGENAVKRYKTGSKVTLDLNVNMLHKHKLKELYTQYAFTTTTAGEWKDGVMTVAGGVACMDKIEFTVFPIFNICTNGADTPIVADAQNPLAFRLSVFPPSNFEMVMNLDNAPMLPLSFEGTIDGTGNALVWGKGLTPPAIV